MPKDWNVTIWKRKSRQGKEKFEAIQTQRLFKHGHPANLTFRFELYQKLLRNFPICLYNQEAFFSQILFHLKCRRCVLALSKADAVFSLSLFFLDKC